LRAARVISAVMTPGSTVMQRLSVSTSRMRFMRSKESRMPPKAGTAPPESPVPAPRGVTGMRCSFARRATAATCSVDSGKTRTSAR
jgi:hypothetical protein